MEQKSETEEVLAQMPLTKNLNELFKSEIYKCLNSYLEINPDKMFCDLLIDNNGEYVFRCKIYAKNIKTINFLSGGER